MALATLILTALTLTVVLGLLVERIVTLRRLRTQLALRGQTVRVHTTDDLTIHAVVVARHADQIILDQAVYVAGAQETVKVDGLVHIPAAKIAFVQALGTGKDGEG